MQFKVIGLAKAKKIKAALELSCRLQELPQAANHLTRTV